MLSAVTVSLHYLPKLSVVNTHTRQTSNYCNLKRTLKIHCHVIVTQQRPTVEQSVSKFRNVSLHGTWLFGLADAVTGHFGLAISVWGHFGHDMSVQKQLIAFVYWNDYIGRRNVTLASVISRAGLKGGNGDNCPGAPDARGAPSWKINMFQIKYSFERFLWFTSNTGIQLDIIFLCCVKLQGPPTATDFSTSLTVCQF